MSNSLDNIEIVLILSIVSNVFFILKHLKSVECGKCLVKFSITPRTDVKDKPIPSAYFPSDTVELDNTV